MKEKRNLRDVLITPHTACDTLLDFSANFRLFSAVAQKEMTFQDTKEELLYIIQSVKGSHIGLVAPRILSDRLLGVKTHDLV